jgi:hypothetical protein
MRRRTVNFPKGILKIKKGYNPNSSSIGTVLYSFPLAFAAFSALIALCAAIIIGKGGKGK